MSDILKTCPIYTASSTVILPEAMSAARGYRTGMNVRRTQELAARIDALVKKRGVSVRSLGASDDKPDLARNILRAAKNGLSYAPRIDSLAIIAKSLSTSVEYLMTGQGAEDSGLIDFPLVNDLDQTHAAPSTALSVPFGGETEAGVYRMFDQHTIEARKRVAILKDPRYPGIDQFAWLVRGDSMDAAGILDGMFALGADFDDFEDLFGTAANGSFVVVERIRANGKEVERTVKELHRFKDRTELRPKSHNPIHKPLIIYAAAQKADDETIKVVAYVVGAFRIFGPPYFDYIT
jgi:SOS-response transcriptional repressor LexA